MKTLKQEGVPLGARVVFRLQHLGFVLMCLLLAPTLPFACIWWMLHESGEEFMEGLVDVVQKRLDRVKAQRDKLVRMYSKFDSA